MSNEDLIKEVEEILKGITEGPWELHSDPCHYDTLSSIRGGSKIPKQGLARQLMIEIGGYANWKEQEANARFVAKSREIVPKLLKALREKEEKVK